MAEEVQINANDLLTGFAGEVAALMQRVVLADLRIRALQRALTETQEELVAAQQELASAQAGGNGEALSPDESQPVP